jgi:hypothetical protein
VTCRFCRYLGDAVQGGLIILVVAFFVLVFFIMWANAP